MRALQQRHLINSFASAKFEKFFYQVDKIDVKVGKRVKPYPREFKCSKLIYSYPDPNKPGKFRIKMPPPCESGCTWCNREDMWDSRKTAFHIPVVDNAALFDKRYFLKHAAEFVSTMPKHVETMSYKTVIDCYDGAKKRRYKTAREEMRDGERLRAWSAVQMFVKPDRYDAGNVWDKAPRAIQFRHPCFNLKMAKFLKPFEHAYYSMVDWTGYRVVAKGQNNLQRAENIVECSKMFDNPVYVLMDHKKFDAHVLVEHLRFLHRIYDRCFRDKRLTKLLQYQIHNRCFSKGGIRYKVEGTRMSGDYDTGLGNTLLNHYMIFNVLHGLKYHLLLDGDDSVVIMEKRDLGRIHKDSFLRMGMETTIEVVTELHQVEFCRAKLLVLDPPRFARDPIRALSNMTVSFKSYPAAGALQYIAGLGVGEAAASNGVPIIGPIAWKMSQAHSKPILDENIKYMYGAAGDPLLIDDDARELFYEQYGISPQIQRVMEKSYVTPRGVCYKLQSQVYNSRPLSRADIFL
ncbi:RNA-dependent RNA polymerase [Erysiphe necator associated tombus-like virus 6]|nr:RNA-dependent RNA polymerase [Erysiphe necator associated tombus-like virus 6]